MTAPSPKHQFRVNTDGFVLHDAPCESRAGLLLIDGIWRAFCRECQQTAVSTLDEIASGMTGRLDPSLFGLQLTPAADTYLDEFKLVWIGTKWDIAERDERFHVYRKGNWVCAV